MDSFVEIAKTKGFFMIVKKGSLKVSNSNFQKYDNILTKTISTQENIIGTYQEIDVTDSAGILADNDCFTTLENIHKFFDRGTMLTKVFFPPNDESLGIYAVPSCSVWRTNKFVVYESESYSLTDPQTYTLFDLKVTDNKFIIDMASEEGNVDFLEWVLNKSGCDQHKLVYSDFAIDCASANGHTNVLEWWDKSGLKLKYTDDAVDFASANNHPAVLDWWKESDLEFKYSNNAVDWASENGHVTVLDWWRKSTDRTFSNLPVVMAQAPSQGTRWSKNSFLRESSDISYLLMKYSTAAIDGAAKNGHIAVIDWWNKSSLSVMYTKNAINWASANGHLLVLVYLKNHVTDFKYSKSAMNKASANGHVCILRWWKASGLKLKYSITAIRDATKNGHTDVLRWWSGVALEFKM